MNSISFRRPIFLGHFKENLLVAYLVVDNRLCFLCMFYRFLNMDEVLTLNSSNHFFVGYLQFLLQACTLIIVF